MIKMMKNDEDSEYGEEAESDIEENDEESDH